MRNLLKLTSILLFALFTLNSNSQVKQKFGHVNSQEILQSMPGKDTVKIALENYKNELEQELVTMQKEFDTKYQKFLAEQEKLQEPIKSNKIKELQNLQQRIEDFKADAQELFANKEDELLSPLIKRAKDAIEKVSKENKYTYIFDAGVGFLLFMDPTDDITPLVKKELGIK